MSLGAVCAQGFKKIISQLFPLVFSTEQQKGQADDYDWDLENENVYYIVDCPAIPATQYPSELYCKKRIFHKFLNKCYSFCNELLHDCPPKNMHDLKLTHVHTNTIPL